MSNTHNVFRLKSAGLSNLSCSLGKFVEQFPPSLDWEQARLSRLNNEKKQPRLVGGRYKAVA